MKDKMVNLSNSEDDSRVRNKNAASTRANLWVKEANNRLNELSKLLFVLAVLVFTISSPLLARTEQLDTVNKVLLLGSWVFNLLSLVFGLLSIWGDITYFSKLRNMENESERIWSQNKAYDQMYEEDSKNRKDYDDKSSLVPLVLQLFSVSIALILLLLIGIRILFT